MSINKDEVQKKLANDSGPNSQSQGFVFHGAFSGFKPKMIEPSFAPLEGFIRDKLERDLGVSPWLKTEVAATRGANVQGSQTVAARPRKRPRSGS